MTRIISTIFWKDLFEALRDRRNVMRMIFMPCLLIPMLGHFFMAFSENHSEKLDKTVLDYAIVGENNLPEIAKLYAADSGFHRVDVPEDKLNESIRNKTIRFAIVIPPDAKQNLGKGEGISIKFLYYQSAPSHGIVKDRGTAPILQYSEKQRDWRLAFLGVEGDSARSNVLSPVTSDVDNIASEREQIGHGLGTILAFPLFIICFVGCAFSAVELATGEKEKGTLEIMVMLPIPRTLIVIAKYLVVFTLGMMYSTLCMLSSAVWLFLESRNASDAFRDVVGQIGISDLSLVWLMLIPVNALFSAVLLAVSVYARSYREATGLSNVANFLVVIAATAIFVPGVNLTWFWSLIPVANVGLVIRELIKGTLNNYLMIGSILATTVAIGTAALLFSIAWFRKERVIFRA